jgi:hypothetical protein
MYLSNKATIFDLFLAVTSFFNVKCFDALLVNVLYSQTYTNSTQKEMCYTFIPIFLSDIY